MEPIAPEYVPLDGGPWRLSMGLRRLELDRWLEVDEHRPEELARKRELLGSVRDTVFVALDGSGPACEELLGLVRGNLRAHHPGLRTDDRDLGAGTGRGSPHPLEVAALLVQEDLCVLERQHGAWRLTAACVCFPSRWSLVEKLGRSLEEIHDPVPGFASTLAGPAARFFDRLSVERPAWRCNWTVIDTGELHLPSAASRTEKHGDVGLADVFFRVERQTLRRLAATDAVVFTIRTYVTPLQRLLVAHPEVAQLLAATLRTVDDDVAAYKGWSGRVERLVAELERRGVRE